MDALSLDLRLRRIAANQASADDSAWLAEAMSHYLENGGRRRLERCMGLIGPRKGVWSNQTRAQLAERDRWLTVAWDELAVSGSEWDTGLELAKQVVSFEEIHWPEWRKLEEPPNGATPLRAALFRAFKARHVRMAKNWRQLKKVVQKHRASCDTKDAANTVSFRNDAKETV